MSAKKWSMDSTKWKIACWIRLKNELPTAFSNECCSDVVGRSSNVQNLAEAEAAIAKKDEDNEVANLRGAVLPHRKEEK